MTGKAITPIAITEAATVPVIAPKIAPTRMTAYAKPPDKPPKSCAKPSNKSSAKPLRSNMAPMSVKNGIDSNNSLLIIPNTRYGKFAINCAGKKSNCMAIKPHDKPKAAKENATGSPSNKKITKAINIAGAINSTELMTIAPYAHNGY